MKKMFASNNPTTGDGMTEKQKEEQKLTKFLRDRDTAPINPPVIQNVPKPDSSTKYGASVLTNMFRIDVKKKKTVYKYRIDITGHRADPNTKSVEFTNPAPSEFYAADRRRVCTRLFNALVESHEDVLGSRTELYYDQRFNLYALNKLNVVGTLEVLRSDYFPDMGEDLEVDYQLCGCIRFEYKITFVNVELSNTLAEDVLSQHFDEFEKETVQFLDIASLQEMASRPKDFVLFGKGSAYYMNPEKHGDNDPSQLPHGVYIAAGLQKHIHVTEGSSTKMSIVIAPKYSLFHTVQRLSNKLAGVGNVGQINDLIKGIYIIPEHLMTLAEHPRLCVAKVIRLGLSANEETFERNGEPITVAEYYAEQYGIELQKPEERVVVCKQGGKTVCYPQEFCIVADNIKVPTNSSTGEYVAALIKKAAKLPNIFQQCVTNAFNALHLKNSEFLNNAGLRVSHNPIEVPALTLLAPSIVYKNNTSAYFETAESAWKTRGTQYYLPAPLAKSIYWVCYAAVRGGSINLNQLNLFGIAYLQMCQLKGLIIGQPADVKVLEVDDDTKDREVKALKKALETAVSYGCKFALVITNKSDTHIHAALKTYEQMFQIITQDVTKIVAFSAAGINTPKKMLTMENIVNKTNMKLGGLNYSVNCNSKEIGKDDLFVGFGLNHVAGGLGMIYDEDGSDQEAGGSAPTVLGYAANDTEKPCAFVGSFIYDQTSRVGNLRSFDKALGIVFQRYLDNRGKSPKRVFIYRNGCSEGELKNVVKFELPLYKKLVQDYFGEETKLVLIVANKSHNVRITPINPKGQRAKEQNVMPGTVVDTEIVHPLYGEFYLASTKALQGTVKAPRYIVLCNDADLSLAEIEKMTYDLCFAHQIVSMPTSLPSPVYIAEEYAKRGRMLFNSGAHLRPGQVQDPNTLTENLSLDGRPDLRDYRVNA